MANTYRTASVIAQVAALELFNALTIAQKVRWYTPEKFYNKGVGMPGPTIDVPLPVRYLAKEGPVLQEQPIIERTKPVTIDQDFHVGLKMEVFDASVNTKEQITKMSSEYIKPAIAALADKADDYAMGMALKLHNTVGTAGTALGSGTSAETQAIFAAARAHMKRAGVKDNEELYCFLDPEAEGRVPVALSGLFVREAQEAVSKGKIGNAMRFNFYGSQNVRYHTAGNGAAFAAGALTNGAGQTGSVINIDGLDALDTLYAGDVITFGAIGTGPQQVNVQNKRVFRVLQEFTVVNTVVANGGAMAVTVSPEIITEGAYQNVNIAVADGLAVTRKASHYAHMAIIKDTLCMSTIKLKKPDSAVIAEVGTYNGLSVLLTAGYDVQSRSETARIDFVFGGREMYESTGVRILG